MKDILFLQKNVIIIKIYLPWCDRRIAVAMFLYKKTEYVSAPNCRTGRVTT